VARGNSKLGGFGRGRRVVEETGPEQAWPADGPAAPAAPSPARNILPGEPFEEIAPNFPSQRSPEPSPFAMSGQPGWGAAPMPHSAGAFGDAGPMGGNGIVPGWPGHASTHPMSAAPGADQGFPGPAQNGADPLDALQQYAGLPLGAAPAPDPAQLYPHGLPPQASANPTMPADHAGGPAGPSSGFADGGIFTGGDLPGGELQGMDAHGNFPGMSFPGASFSGGDTSGAAFSNGRSYQDLPPQGFPPAPPAPQGYDPHGSAGGFVPHSSFEPLDGPHGAGAFGNVLPGSEASAEGRHKGRRRSKPDNGHHRDGADGAGSRSGSRRAVLLLGSVAVLAAAGYVGYSQLSGTDDPVTAVTTPVRPATPATPTNSRFTLPADLVDLVQITPAQSASLTAGYTKLSAQKAPNLAPPLVATSYHRAGSPVPLLNVVIYRPGAVGTFQTIVRQLSQPAPGTASVPAVPVPGGAAGGTMLCGSQRGSAPSAWCAWNSGKSIGFVQALNTTNAGNPATFARELRAYTEH
jgi:hypothetical protein